MIVFKGLYFWHPNEQKDDQEQDYNKIMVMDYDMFPTPWRIQMWVQIEDNGRARSRGTLPSSQHFRGVKRHAGTLGLD
jgi:hypothetical protein